MEWIEVRGESMRPALEPGDEVQVEWGAGGSFKLGEIVLAKRTGEELTVHRVVGLRPFRTKGDYSLSLDEFLDSEVMGRVTAVKRRGARSSVVVFSTRWTDRLVAWFSGRAVGFGIAARIQRRVALLISKLSAKAGPR